MIKVNCICDCNYILLKNVFILKKIRSLRDLESLLIRDIKKITQTYPFDNIYIVSDSKEQNWRKMIYQEYKGKRKKDATIDWKYVYEIYNNFKDYIKTKRNIKLLESPGLEGDDFIAYIVNESNKEGYSNVIVASDGDLQQLLKYDLNNHYINIQWNYRLSDERVYLPENYQLFLDKMSNIENDIFNPSNNAEFINYLENLIMKTRVKSIIKEEVLFTKIVQGDSSDNIISIIKIKDGKLDPENGRGIGENGAISVYKLYKEIHPEPIDFDSDEFIDRLIEVIIYYKKIKNCTFKQSIRENIILNRQLISLDSKFMPEQFFENMVNNYKKVNEYVEYEVENLEEKYDDDFFNDVPEDIPEQFRIEEKTIDNDSFDPDSFWDL